jgi:hypothetical protein
MLAVRCMRLYARGYQSERIDREPAGVARQRRPMPTFLPVWRGGYIARNNSGRTEIIHHPQAFSPKA